MRDSGYRRISAVEQILYVFAALIRRKWAWIFGKREKQPVITKVETNCYDKEEIIENCTVQILTNTTTGEVSVGWWRNMEEQK